MIQASCHRCGQKDLVAGLLQSTGTLHFRPMNAKFLTLRTADISLNSQMCAACGHVMLTGDAEKLRQLMQDRPATAACARG